MSPPTDFESVTSTNSIIPADRFYIIQETISFDKRKFASEQKKGGWKRGKITIRHTIRPETMLQYSVLNDGPAYKKEEMQISPAVAWIFT